MYLLGTVNLYSKRAAIVQSGWRTQVVSFFSIDTSEMECKLTYAQLGTGCHFSSDIRHLHHLTRHHAHRRQPKNKNKKDIMNKTLIFQNALLFGGDTARK